jgi:hypothetical protein
MCSMCREKRVKTLSEQFSADLPERTCQWGSTAWNISWTFIYVLWATMGLTYTVYVGANYILNPQGVWDTLPNICCSPYQKAPIYLHAIGATLVLLLGPFQMLQNIYHTKLHRYTGIVYIMGCVFSSLAGMVFILWNRTVGGIVMDVAFILYGWIVFMCAIITSTLAVKGVSDPIYRKYHRAWALRTTAVAPASVFYRILYFILYFVTKLLPDSTPVLHTSNFRGPVDYVFDFAFFLIPLLVVEVYLIIYYLGCDIKRYARVCKPEDRVLDTTI